MSPDEMAAELRRIGWRVQPPLTQENCEHTDKIGSGGINTDGSGYMNLTCKSCGKQWHRTMEPNPEWPSMSLALK